IRKSRRGRCCLPKNRECRRILILGISDGPTLRHIHPRSSEAGIAALRRFARAKAQTGKTERRTSQWRSRPLRFELVSRRWAPNDAISAKKYVDRNAAP